MSNRAHLCNIHFRIRDRIPSPAAGMVAPAVEAVDPFRMRRRWVAWRE